MTFYRFSPLKLNFCFNKINFLQNIDIPGHVSYFKTTFSRGFNTEIALRLAKENVEKHYAVVGVLEELNKTLTVLEHYVPRFFKGAKDVYWSK